MRSTFVLLSFFILSACDWRSNPIDSMFDTYIERIANVQDEPPLPLEANQNTILPPKRELYTDVAPITLGLLDSYELRKCDLFNLIADKNSSLGKVQDPFRNFDYQVNVIEGLNLCVQSQDISSVLKAQLTPILMQKMEQLPIHFSNLVFTSEAMRAQLSGYNWVDEDIKVIPSTLKNALETLEMYAESLSSTPQNLSFSTLVSIQETLNKQTVLGRLNYSLVNATHKLKTTTSQLNANDQNIVCAKGRDKTRFNILRNVFQSYYVDKLQPYLANLDSQYLSIEPFLTFTDTTHPIYVYPIRDNHAKFRGAVQQHVGYWKRLFERCGAAPSR
ncbi:DUF3080 domain-containing protein [Vibrio atypicus]|uniref:DUF3080 domain-containing protein n=1 Tax=Vibrio atypicus TaxID=558271 RepID=UPI0013579D70|nr:DUF3080 domain-containing protein [Vibrio atypicus]